MLFTLFILTSGMTLATLKRKIFVFDDEIIITYMFRGRKAYAYSELSYKTMFLSMLTIIVTPNGIRVYSSDHRGISTVVRRIRQSAQSEDKSRG